MWMLLISRATDPPGAFYDRRQIDSGQIIVGRSEKKCDLILPDEEGFVSREHCTISVVGLELFVVDTSTNGVALNQAGSRIAPSLPVPIRPNDRLIIGSFVITVATEAMGLGVSLVPSAPAPLPLATPTSGQDDPWFTPPADPVWDSGPMGLGDGGVHDFLSHSINDMLAPGPSPFDIPELPSDFGFGDPLGQAFLRPIMADPLPPPTDFGIPEDWANAGSAPLAPDPFGGFPSPGLADKDPFGDLSSPDPFSDPFPPPSQGRDPFGDEPTLDPFAFDPVAPPPAMGDPFDLSAPVPPASDPFAASPPPSSPPPPTAPSAAMAPDAGWAAFFEGAGLSPEELHLSPDAMRRMGVLYRQVVLGLWDIIQDRAAFKDEFRVERTQLSIGRNNPLKHLPPLDAAKILLGDPLPGFMPADEAVRTAFEDIKKHQLAMLAGVQQALKAVFDRLSPAEIQKLGEKASAQRKGLPFKRGIDPWSVYLTVFDALKRDATSNANGVMSVAFREGYETFLKSAG